VFRPETSPLAECEGLLGKFTTLPFYHFAKPSSVRVVLEDSLSIGGKKLDVPMETHQLATAGRMVASGLGVSVVPALCIQQMPKLGARCIPLTSPVLERPIGILTKADHELFFAAQALTDTLGQLDTQTSQQEATTLFGDR